MKIEHGYKIVGTITLSAVYENTNNLKSLARKGGDITWKASSSLESKVRFSTNAETPWKTLWEQVKKYHWNKNKLEAQHLILVSLTSVMEGDLEYG